MNYKHEIVKVLKNLTENYPTQLIANHISIALSEYPNFGTVSDKEFYWLLEKYRCMKELDMVPQISADELYQDGLSDDELFDIEDEDY